MPDINKQGGNHVRDDEEKCVEDIRMCLLVSVQSSEEEVPDALLIENKDHTDTNSGTGDDVSWIVHAHIYAR